MTAGALTELRMISVVIVEDNALDIELYEFARTLVAERHC